jgi:tripartite-type tricarboxylate transporter receptor subunit TctC
MPFPHFASRLCAVALMVMTASVSCAQEFPAKPIRIVTPGIGGTSDFTSRLIAQGISSSLGQQVIVDNRPAGFIPGQVVSQAAPDGYVVLLTSSSLWVGPLMQNTPYDAVKDFAPITTVTRAPNILVVHPSLPVKSVKDLISLAKTKPGELNYASGAIGASNHLAPELFKAMAQVSIARISYKSASIQMSDLLGGHVQLTFASGGTVTPFLKSGRLRALAVTTAEPSPVAPGLPTVSATVPGYELVTHSGVFAPARTPEAAIHRINQEIVRFLGQADAKQKFLDSGVEAVSSTPEQLAAIIKSEISRLARVIKDAGIRAD